MINFTIKDILIARNQGSRKINPDAGTMGRF